VARGVGQNGFTSDGIWVGGYAGPQSFFTIQDRRGRLILSIRDQNTFDKSLRRKLLCTSQEPLRTHPCYLIGGQEVAGSNPVSSTHEQGLWPATTRYLPN